MSVARTSERELNGAGFQESPITVTETNVTEASPFAQSAHSSGLKRKIGELEILAARSLRAYTGDAPLTATQAVPSDAALPTDKLVNTSEDLRGISVIEDGNDSISNSSSSSSEVSTQENNDEANWNGEAQPDRLEPPSHPLNKDDKERVLAAVAEVKEAFRREKWKLVAQAIDRMGGTVYPEAFVREQYKKIARERKEAGHASPITGKETIEDPPVVSFSGHAAGENQDRTDVTISANHIGQQSGNLEYSSRQNTPTGKQSRLGYSRPINQKPHQRKTHAAPATGFAHPLHPENTSQPHEFTWSPYARYGGFEANGYNFQRNPPENPPESPPPEQTTSAPTNPINHVSTSSVSAIGEQSTNAPTNHVPISSVLATDGTKSGPRSRGKYRKSTGSADALREKSQSRRSVGRPKKVVNKKKLIEIVKHRNQNETNRQKPWVLIAEDCGVTVSLSELSDAFKEAGYSSIIPIDPALQTVADVFSPSSSSSESTPVIRPADGNEPVTSSNPSVPTVGAERNIESPHAASTPSHQLIPPAKGKNPTPESHRSEAMRKAWARRKAREQNTPRQPSLVAATTSNESIMGSSPSAFAAQVLAAAEALSGSSPDPAITAPNLNPNPTSVSPLNHSESHNEPISAPASGKNQSRQKRGPYKKRTEDVGEGQFKCEKCGKKYQQSSGLKYHQQHSPNCDVVPPRRDKRTDPTGTMATRAEVDPAAVTMPVEDGALPAPPPVAQMSSATETEVPTNTHTTEIPQAQENT